MTLVLIRHAAVTIEPHQPGSLWSLSLDGVIGARRLGESGALREVGVFVTSPEPKAAATAVAIASGRTIIPVPGVSELDRSAAGWIGDDAEYMGFMREVFANPDRMVRGCESARHAQARMVIAINEALTAYGGSGLAIVSHGIVLSLYVAYLNGQRAPDLEYWRSIRLPTLLWWIPQKTGSLPTSAVWLDTGTDIWRRGQSTKSLIRGAVRSRENDGVWTALNSQPAIYLRTSRQAHVVAKTRNQRGRSSSNVAVRRSHRACGLFISVKLRRNASLAARC